MISFRNDYNECCHPEIFERISKLYTEKNTGYGLDKHSKRAQDLIKDWLGEKDLDVHFIPGGTGTNLLAIKTVLKPFEGVIACDSGHISIHEVGAIEATGHKVIMTHHKEGKLTPEAIRACMVRQSHDFSITPAMIYISNTTELGTVYKKSELADLRKVCDEYGLKIFLDGARLSYALNSPENDLSAKELMKYVDILFIGGTKAGLMLGEALVFKSDIADKNFRKLLKQRGNMLAKGFLMGMQFERLFEDDLYMEIGKQTIDSALEFAKKLESKGIEFYAKPVSNQIFIILDDEKIEALEEKFEFEFEKKIDESSSAIRLVTSWATKSQEIDAFVDCL
ncbi:MAG: aminotransferase class I/II-fold pyridoxal phosphate-dependent enzyme [Tissierellia bacterium]|nr:aminotransferase class I/II-fold pyridoxal phosphate-dependent enzyme [Tissierellia bacterium]